MKNKIAILYMDGEAIGSGLWWDRDETLIESLRNNRGDSWRWDGNIPKAEMEKIRKELEAAGKNPTDDEIRKTYAELKGIAY